MASKTVTRSIKYKQKPMSFWYKCYVLLKQNPFPSMHLAFSSLVHLTAIFFFVFLCCVADPRGKYFFPCSWESHSKAGSGGWGRYRSRQMKRASMQRQPLRYLGLRVNRWWNRTQQRSRLSFAAILCLYAKKDIIISQFAYGW